jgi:predicted dehydrogenase
MGLLHAAVFNSLEGSRVVAVTEPAELPREVLSKFNPTIRMFNSIERMLAECPLDAVVIATPVANHVPAAFCCLQKRVPFLVEKPLAVSAAQAQELVQSIQQNPLPNMVGFMTRFVSSFAKGQTIIASGCLGHIQRVTGTIYVSQLFTRGKGWRYDRKVSGGGVLLSQGSHLLDLLTWYFGHVVRVNAEVLSVYSPEIEDFAHVMLEFRSGLRGWIDSSWSVRGKRTLETSIDILGDNGSLFINDDTVRLHLDQPSPNWSVGQTLWRAPDLYQSVPVDIGGPHYTREDQAFLTTLQTQTMPAPDVLQAYHVQQLIDAAYASSVAAGAPQFLNA